MDSSFIFSFSSAIGVHVQQILSSCQLIDSSISGPFYSGQAFNGVGISEEHFNTEQMSVNDDGWLYKVFQRWEKETRDFLVFNVYNPMCIKTLKNCLHMMKNDVMRKGKVL